MEKKSIKTEVQIEAEKKEAEALIVEISQCINKVPKSVLAGSVQSARSWKENAFKAMKLADSKQPKLEALRSAVQALRVFDKAKAA
jgi:hypothetical protein